MAISGKIFLSLNCCYCLQFFVVIFLDELAEIVFSEALQKDNPFFNVLGLDPRKKTKGTKLVKIDLVEDIARSYHQNDAQDGNYDAYQIYRG